MSIQKILEEIHESRLENIEFQIHFHQAMLAVIIMQAVTLVALLYYIRMSI